jgi:hypothetical protein
MSTFTVEWFGHGTGNVYRCLFCKAGFCVITNIGVIAELPFWINDALQSKESRLSAYTTVLLKHSNVLFDKQPNIVFNLSATSQNVSEASVEVMKNGKWYYIPVWMGCQMRNQGYKTRAVNLGGKAVVSRPKCDYM